MTSFLDSVRQACPSALWSQGVKLARAGAVSAERVANDEATYRVTERGRAVAPTVILYPGDNEWDCDCGSKVATCAHVAAAAIIFAGGGEAAVVAPSEDIAPRGEVPAFARIVYRLSVDKTALRLDRFHARADGTEQKLDLSLADRIGRGIADPPLQPTHDDLTVDRVIGKRLHGDVPFAEIPRVLGALASSDNVWFDNARVKTSGDPIGTEARLSDLPNGGVEVSIRMHRSIESVVAMGVAKTSAGLAPLAVSLGFGLSFERIPPPKAYRREQLGELAAEVLGPLEKKMPVEIATHRLPRLGKGDGPRLRFELSVEETRLSVLPLLVYGDPPAARIDAGKLVLLDRRRTLPARDEARERTLIERLRDDLSLVPGRRVTFDGRDAARFTSKLEAFEGGTSKVGNDDHRRTLVPRLFEIDGGYDLVFEVESDEAGSDTTLRRASADMALWAHREGIGIVPLEGGGFARLPPGFLDKHADKVADLLAARAEGERGAKAALSVVVELADALGAPRPKDADRIATLAQGFEGVPRIAPPSDLRAELRPYQVDGVSWLTFLRDAELGALLADDMGLGKTLQTIAALRGRVLVVCPRSVVHNWANEIARYRPSLTTTRHGGRGALLSDADVTLTTYGLLRSDTEALAERAWDIVVLDEAQAIKNPDSQTARAALRLDARFRVALTGTPVENRLEELFSIMRFLNPGVLGSRTSFRATYAEPIDRGDAAVAARLRSRIRPFLLRRKKADVLTDLPPLVEAVETCELEPDERAVYDAVRAATQKDIVERLKQGGTVLAVLEALLRLRQAACHADLVPGQSRATSSKVERLVEMLLESRDAGHRALVFSQWTSLLDRVEPHLREAGLDFTRLDGSTRDREGVVTTFQAPDGPPVMLVSLKAGGTGLNLTAADHVFLLDPWWNPAVEEQAEARAHRIGQERAVVVHRLITKDTVEERIFALQEKKKRLADAAIGDGGGGAAITRDDLLALLA